MEELYELNGKQYSLPLDEVAGFLKSFPEAKKVNQDFQTPTAPGAVVEEPIAPDMVSQSESGSSESQNNPLGLPTFTLDEARANTPKQPEGAVSENFQRGENLKKLNNTVKYLINNGQRRRNALPDDLRGKSLKEIVKGGTNVVDIIKKRALDSYTGNVAGSMFTFGGNKLHNEVYNDLNLDETDFEKSIEKVLNEAILEEGKIQQETVLNSNIKKEDVEEENAFIINNLSPSKKALQEAIKKEQELNEIILNGNPTEKTQAQLELNKLTPTLDGLAKKIYGPMSDTKFLFDGNKQRIDDPNAPGVQDLTAEYQAELETQQELAKTDYEKLEQNYFYHLQEYRDNQRLINQTIDFAPNGNNADFQAINLFNKGYKEYRTEDGTRVFKDVPLKDLLTYSGQDDVDFTDFRKSGSEGAIKLDVAGIFKDYKEDAARLALEREAYTNTIHLNIDPASRKKSAITTVERFFETATEAFIGKENAEKIGTSTIKELDQIQNIMINSGLRLTDAQKENFERSFALKAAENIGYFVPELAKFAIVNSITGGALSATGAAKLLRGLQTSKRFQDKATYHFLMAAMEEAKFEAVTLGEAKPFAGSGFYLGGTAFRSVIPFKFKGNAAQYNQLLGKVVGGGVGGAVASETALVAEGLYQQLAGNKTFMKEMEELFGEDSDWVERFGLSAVTFATIGATNAKASDFKSIKQREAIVNKALAENKRLQQENILLQSGEGGPLPSSPANQFKINNRKIEQNLAKIHYLKKDIDRANESYNKLDLKKVVERRDAADNIIINPESSLSQIKQARKDKAEANAQLRTARASITNSLENLKASKTLGEFDYVVKEGKEGFVNKENNAEFDAKGPNGKPVIRIDLLSYQKGMQAHEVTHLLMKQLFKSNPDVANKMKFYINKLINEKLKDSGLEVGDIAKLEDLIDLNYKNPKNRGEEYIGNLVQLLQNPTYARLLTTKQDNVLMGIRSNIMNMLSINKIKPENQRLEGDNIRTAQDLVNFLGSFGKNVESGKDISKQVEGFKNLKLDGDILYDLTPTSKTTKTKGSKNFKGVEKLEELIRQNKEFGAGGFRNELVEINLKKQIKKVEKLETEYSASELRDLIKKAKAKEKTITEKLGTTQEIGRKIDMLGLGEKAKKTALEAEYEKVNNAEKARENLELALEEKFAAFKGEVELAGLNIKTGDVKASRKLVKQAETNIERQILKQRTGNFEGNKILQDNIDLQYNKIAMAALGFKLKKSFDAQSLGLKRAEFDDALSFVNQYKDGIIKRWKPEITNPETGETQSIKFSTFVNANIQPKRALFYEQAFGKNAEVTGRITEKTKEIADIATSTEKAPDLIDPLSFSKDATVIKKYEAGLKNIDLSKQDYSTLKDVAPKVTDKIFGEAKTVIKDGKKVKISAHEVKQEFIKNNAKALYDLLPLAFRRMTEGTKSSTGINPGILKNFYVTGGRADMTVGTRAGLAVKAKIPWANASKKFNELFTAEKTGNELRNQKTLVKGLQAEIGKAITNSVARRNPKHPEALIRKLADGKSEVLAAKTLDLFRNIEKEPKISAEFERLFGIKNRERDISDVQKGIYELSEKLATDLVPFLKAGAIAPIGKSYIRIVDQKRKTTFFVSGKEFDKLTKKAINEGDVLGLLALKSIAENNAKGTEAPTWAKSITAQTLVSYNSKVKKGNYKTELNDHIINVKDILDVFAEMYRISPKATGVLVYNVDASSSPTRNMAFMRGKEFGAKKTREEHVLQQGQFAILVGEYAKLKNSPTTMDLAGMAKWMGENYFQISLKAETKKGISFKDGTSSHSKVDRKQEFDGVTVDMKSQFHPVMAKQIKEALAGKRKWSEVISPFIRMFNSQIAKGKGGSINMNVIEFDIKPLSNYFDLAVPKRFELEKPVYEKQAELAERQMLEPGFKGKKELDLFIKERYPKIKEGIKTIEKNKEKDIKLKEKQIEVYASKDLNKEFNRYLEISTGIGADKVFSDAKAAARGKKAKKSFGDYFVPVGAEDFAGLMHKTLARGKAGERQLKFYEESLYDPYNLAMENITRERVALTNDFRALKDQLATVPKTLKKFTKQGDFTNEQAVRVAVWNKLGYEIPGLSKTDKAQLIKEVKNNTELNTFANELVRITKGDGYTKPDASWIAGNIAIDFVSLLNGSKRTKHLEVWENNVAKIFSKENLNKLEAAYGKNFVTTLNKTITRMRTGMNRKWGGNATVEKWNDWVNGSVGAIMFLNTRSAVLQTISSINYMNFTDNNPLQAAKAFANQKQFWKDFKDIFNSDYLKDRRGGLKINVNESELALAAEKGGARGVIAMLLNKGFVLTRAADSFAIAAGGSAMYRNRINTYQKQGLSKKEAQEKAFLDFKKITEETQQSSRPDRISEQQASNLGRFMLAFANTPMQYNRIIKKNVQDLLAGRGDPREKLSRIMYYSTIQNILFNALKNAMFGLAFDDEDNQEKKIAALAKTGDGMLDSLLRGSGLVGNAVVAIKNVAKAYVNDAKEPALQALTISPPMYSKVSKLRSAFYERKFITKQNILEPSLNNPALNSAAQFSSAIFNFPLDRALRKGQNIEAAMFDEAEYWQKAALLMGWNTWELGLDEDQKREVVINPRRQTRRKSTRRKSTRRKR